MGRIGEMGMGGIKEVEMSEIGEVKMSGPEIKKVATVTSKL